MSKLIAALMVGFFATLSFAQGGGAAPGPAGQTAQPAAKAPAPVVKKTVHKRVVKKHNGARKVGPKAGASKAAAKH